jgi:hypothetical protein
VNLVDVITPIERYALKLFARDVQYQPLGAPAPSVLRGVLRSMNPEELQAAAIQQGWLFTIDAALFVTVVGNETPRRYDRVVANGQRYSVERWHGAPGIPPFTFFKVTLLGSEQ